MAFIDGLLQSETLPVLEAAMSFSYQKQLAITNNIANVDTPRYKRQGLADGEFRASLQQALEDRATKHPNRFTMDGSVNINIAGGYTPVASIIPAMDGGLERHDENSVVMEREMAELAKNTMAISGMQRLYKKKLDLLRSSLRDRVI